MSRAQSFHAEAVTIHDLFGGSAAYEVPPFQRPFAWTPDEVDTLFNDLFGSGSFADLSSARAPYFLGSIVLASGDGTLKLLDGQQRLTTIALLMTCLRHEFMAVGAGNHAAHLQSCILFGVFGQLRPRLRLQPEDATAYEALLDNPARLSDRKPTQSLLMRAARRIRKNIETRAEEARRHGLRDVELLELMTRHLLDNVELIKIETKTESLAYRIFETLNDRGLPLNGADLIKNKVLSMSTFHQEDVHSAWNSVANTVGETEILNFLRHYWLASRGLVQKDQLYDVYSDHLDKLGESAVLDFVKTLEKAAGIYAQLISPDADNAPWSRETTDVLARLVELRARSCRPLLLACAQRYPEQLLDLANLCESASVRHTLVCQRNPNQLERAYATVCRNVRGGARDLVAATLIELNKLVPSDSDFMQSFNNVRATSTAQWRPILIRLNEHLSTGETRVADASRVHIEHILPQTPSRASLKESGLTQSEADELSGMLGNLTLLSGKKNQAISNQAFSMKRDAFLGSELTLNKTVTKFDVWGKKQIHDRTRELAGIARDTWTWPHAKHRVQPVRASARKSINQVIRKPAPDLQELPLKARESPEKGNKVSPPAALTPLTGEPLLHDTVWLPRVLWGLEWASQNGRGPIHASQIAEILNQHGGMNVAPPNVARAFRDFRKNELPDGYFELRPAQTYSITEMGRMALRSILR